MDTVYFDQASRSLALRDNGLRTLGEAAKELDCSVAAVRNWLDSGVVEHFREHDAEGARRCKTVWLAADTVAAIKAERAQSPHFWLFRRRLEAGLVR